jgi:hypothetical protein
MKKVLGQWTIEGLTVTVTIDTEGIEAVAGEICKRLRVEVTGCGGGEKDGKKKKSEPDK